MPDRTLSSAPVNGHPHDRSSSSPDHDHGAHQSHDHGPLTLAERHTHEAETYDAMSEQILQSWDDAAYLVDPERIPFPNREQVDYLSEAVRRLGPLADRRILEVGAGGGSLAVWLALQGAEVVGIDVSDGILSVARKRAELNGVAATTTFVHAPVETFDPLAASLGFAQFDAIIGNNVVHHFERDLALANLGRLLAPGAVGVFCEPVLFLPEVARTVRNSALVTRRFPMHTHSPDERSLGEEDFAIMRRWFRHVAWTPHQLFCRLQNFYELSDRTWSRLEALDRSVLHRFRFTARLCRIAVIELGLPLGDSHRRGSEGAPVRL